MTGLSKIDSKALGEFQDAPTREEAALALIGADIETADVTRVIERATFGRFVATQIAGGAIAVGEFHQGAMEKAQRAMMAILDDAKAPLRTRILAAEAVPKIAGMSASTGALQLKAAEMLAFGKKGKDRKSNAPSSITGISVTAENVQINSQPALPPTEKAA